MSFFIKKKEKIGKPRTHNLTVGALMDFASRKASNLRSDERGIVVRGKYARLFGLGLLTLVALLFIKPDFVHALFLPGQTLDPTCLPTDLDCTIVPPATLSDNVDPAQIDEGAILLGSSSNTFNALVPGNTDDVLTIQPDGLPGWLPPAPCSTCLVDTGSYTDPSWLAGLDSGKITNTGGVTAGVGIDLTGNTGNRLLGAGDLTLTLSDSGVTAGSYGSATQVPVVTVDAKGRVTSVTNTTIPTASGTTTGLLTSTDWNTFNSKENVLSFTTPLARAGNTVSITQSSGTTNGYLSSTDWNTFNNKENAIASGTTAQYFRGDKTFQTLDTAVVPENGNLYWTQGRFDTAFTGKTTTNLAEGTNLYYTDARFDTRLGTKTTTNLAEGTNLYYTQGRFDTAFGGKSTTNLSEGTNLYYTDARFDTRLGSKTTDNLTEGTTNLYFTNARARNALSASSPLQYNSTSGQFTITQANASTDGYLSLTDWNTFNDKLNNSLGSGLLWIGNASGVPTAAALSGDATISNAGALTIAADAVALGTDTTGTYVAGNTAGTGILVTGSAGEAWSPTIAIDQTAGLSWTGTHSFTNANGLTLNPYGTSAGNTTALLFKELAANGTNTVGFKSPDALAANVLWTLPNADGSSGQTLSTNGSGALSWITPFTNSLTSGNIFVGNGSNLAASVAMSGDATISNTGALTVATSAITSGKILDGAIVDTDVNASAAIALSKLSSGTSIVTSLAAPSGTNANGGSIASNVLTLSLADGTNPGLVSTGTQTIAGAKTFSGTLTSSAQGVTLASATPTITGNTLYNNAGALYWNGDTLSDQAGKTWTSRTSAADNDWNSVTYGNGLFVAVAATGIGNRVMTSPDGINWTARTSAADNNWRAVTYGNGLFVAVADSGTGNRVMTSPDGINWTARTSAANNSWYGITYGNGLFVAVAISGTSNRVMTSPDGINWTIRTSAADNNWFGVTYGNGLFVAVAYTGSGNRVMTSPDGITWTIRTSAADNQWYSVTYGSGLFVAVADTGTGNRVMTSPDGINWTARTSAANNGWISVTYGNGLFVALAYSGTGNRVMTSGKAEINALAHNNQYNGNTLFTGALAFKAGATYTTAGSANNVALGNASLIRLDTAGSAQTLTGIVAGSDGQLLTLMNTDATNAVTLSNNSASSSDGNKIITGTGADLTLVAGASILLQYDSTGTAATSFWRVIGGSGGSGGSGATTLQTITTTGSVSGWGYTVKGDATSATVAVTLPTASGNSGKLIEVVRTDNSANALTIDASGSETINGSTNVIALYSQGDSIVLRSDGTNVQVVADNRSSVGQSKSYLFADLSANNTSNFSIGNHAPLNRVVNQSGSAITLDTTTAYTATNNVASLGRFTLKAGKTYSMRGQIIPVGYTSGASAYVGFKWFNADTGSQLGNEGSSSNGVSTDTNASQSEAVAYFTPTVDTRVELRMTGYVNAGTTWFEGDPNVSGTYAVIEEVSTPQNVINTVEYVHAKLAGQTSVANGAAVPFNTSIVGNIPVTNGVFTLLAGKTYQLSGAARYTGNEGLAEIHSQWRDITNNTLIGNPAVSTSHTASTNNATQSIATAVITPTTNITVRLENTTGGARTADVQSFASIAQIGSTANTGVPLNMLIGAVASGALDNTNFGQVWDWSTLTTEDGFTLQSNSLTTGSILKLLTTSTNNGALSLDVQGSVAFRKGTDYTTAGSANDVNLGNGSLVRLDTSGTAQTLTGIAGGEDGELLTLMNVDASLSVMLSNESASSTASNRIITGTGADLTISAGVSVMLMYDSTSSRWRVIGGTGGGGSGATTLQTITTTGSVSGWGYTVKGDATSATVAVTLPTASGNSGKLIEVVRTDNSSNALTVDANGSETINGSINVIALYSQGDSIVLRSDGTNVQVVADNRSSVGQGKSFVFADLSANNTSNFSVGNHAPLNRVVNQFGSAITLDTTTAYTATNNVASLGRFTLKAGKTYSMRGQIMPLGYTSGTSAYIGFGWYNADTGAALGNEGGSSNGVNTDTNVSQLEAVAYFAPTVDTRVELRMTGYANAGTQWYAGNTNIPGTYAVIEEVSTPQNVINTVDYFFGTYGTSGTAPAVLPVTQISNSGITFNASTNAFTLTAGKTYFVKANMGVTDAIQDRGCWQNYPAGTAISGLSGTDCNYITGSSAGYRDSGEVSFIITPSTNLTIAWYQVAGTFSPYCNSNASSSCSITIQQLGSTAATGLALNALQDALAAGSLDNANFAQTWDWSTATTQTGLTLNLNALTSGSGVSIVSSSSSLNSTSGLLYVANTGASTNGILARFQANNTTGSGLTIRASGNVGIGTTAPSDRLDVQGDIRVGTGTTGCVKDADGTILVGTCSSDITLKTNLLSFPDGALAKLAGIKIVRFNWRDNPTGEKQLGVIAQQVEQVAPELVTLSADGIKQVHFEQLPFYTLKGLQELNTKVDGQGLQILRVAEALDISKEELDRIMMEHLARTQDAQQTAIEKMGAQVEELQKQQNMVTEPVAADSELSEAQAETRDNGLTEQLVAFVQSLMELVTTTAQGTMNFLADVIFEKPVTFNDHLTVDTDTAGTVTLAKDETTVHVTFEKEYKTAPVVTLTVRGIVAITYGVENVDTKGFDIVIDPRQDKDVLINWIVFAVKATPTPTPTPSISSSPSITPSPTPEVSPTPTPTVQPLPTPEEAL